MAGTRWILGSKVSPKLEAPQQHCFRVMQHADLFRLNIMLRRGLIDVELTTALKWHFLNQPHYVWVLEGDKSCPIYAIITLWMVRERIRIGEWAWIHPELPTVAENIRLLHGSPII
jgi:hypothetical protein